MPKGGARPVSGPPPDPTALRRNRPADKAGWTTLPAEGRVGGPPAWPLAAMTDREFELWRDLWTKPQAVAWESLDQGYEVALFVRALAQAEQPDAKVELQRVVRSYLDSLGLSVQGMLRNRWKVAATEAEETPRPASGPASRRPSARDRLRIVPRGEGG
ncbi:hypothetical protein AB0L04_22480 [Streptomyces glaucescens]|uniref:phage terminase small subunit n=1 Tax=Streptomyces glaucescens TaxID=1907 RepID=UPI00344F9FA1